MYLTVQKSGVAVVYLQIQSRRDIDFIIYNLKRQYLLDPLPCLTFIMFIGYENLFKAAYFSNRCMFCSTFSFANNKERLTCLFGKQVTDQACNNTYVRRKTTRYLHALFM